LEEKTNKSFSKNKAFVSDLKKKEGEMFIFVSSVVYKYKNCSRNNNKNNKQNANKIKPTFFFVLCYLLFLICVIALEYDAMQQSCYKSIYLLVDQVCFVLFFSTSHFVLIVLFL
jgi:hypothetical protein